MSTKRQPNFVIEEERLLIALVDRYKNIIECKKSGSTAWTEKNRAWETIQSKFNAENERNIFRSADNLKEKYNNLKKKTKQKFASEKLNIKKTGGGPYVTPDVNDVEKAINDIIGPQGDGLKNNYDDDADNATMNSDASDIAPTEEANGRNHDMESTCEETASTSTNQQSVVIGEAVVDANVLTNNTWRTYTKKNLKAPISTKLQVKRAATRKVLISKEYVEKRYIPLTHDLTQAKLQFVQEQHAKFLEKHAIKMKIVDKTLKIKSKKCEMLDIEDATND